MISGGRFLAAFSGHTGAQDNPELFQGVVRAAARMGFALLFVKPDSKEPLCPLTSRALKLADTAAQEAAREAGHPRWDRARHDCGRAHATDDPKALDAYLKRLQKAGQPMPNLAIDVGRSRMLCVDVDTPAEYQGWRDSWRRATDTEWDSVGELTVKSPGVYDPATGTWKHHGGGHIWIDLSTVEPNPNRDLLLSVGEGIYKDPSGWTAMYRDKYVLVPPSVRDGRGYTFEGSPISANVDWLLAIAANAAAQRESRRIDSAERRAERLRDPGIGLGEAGLIRWSTETSWTELLAPLGWVDTGLVHSCGCPDWTMAPVDDHASPRSATAHEDGCSASGFDNDEGHAPLMIWSDNRPPFLVNVPRDGAKIMTKLQFAAAVARPELRHGEPLNADDIAAGYRAHGLASDGAQLHPLDAAVTADTPPARPVTVDQVTAAVALPPVTDRPTLPIPAAVQPPPELGTLGIPPTSPARHPHVLEPTAPVTDPDAPILSYLRNPFSVLDDPVPEPLIPGVLDLGDMFRIYGASGSGKTHVAVSLAVAVAAGVPWAGHECVGRGRVLYIAPEDPKGVMRRVVASIRDLGFPDSEGVGIGADLLVQTYTGLSANTPRWLELVNIVKAWRPTLILVDTQAQVSSQHFEENSNRDMAMFVDQVAMLRDVSGAAVGLVAHTGKDAAGTGKTKSARGASSVTGSMDVEYWITSDKDTSPGAATITITNTKAKSRPEWTEDLSGFLVPSGDSVAMSFDPVRRPVPPRPDPSADAGLMTAGREKAVTQELAAGGSLAGMTRGQAVAHLVESGADNWRASKNTWRACLDRMMDAGMLGDRDGTAYSRTTGPGSEKVYSASMPLHLVTQPEPPSTPDTAPPIPDPAPGPGPEV